MSVHAISSTGLFCPVVQSSVFFAAGRFRAAAGETVAGCSLFLRRGLPTFGLRWGIAATAARCSAQLPVRAGHIRPLRAVARLSPLVRKRLFLHIVRRKKKYMQGYLKYLHNKMYGRNIKKAIAGKIMGAISCQRNISPYFCTVFFIVLDLRLTRLGYSGIPFFMP